MDIIYQNKTDDPLFLTKKMVSPTMGVIFLFLTRHSKTYKTSLLWVWQKKENEFRIVQSDKKYDEWRKI